MKARVKGTADIIEVEFNKDALNACYPPYHDKEHNMYYQPEQLEWVDNEANAEPDYWTKLEHQYAGMAMQSILQTMPGVSDPDKYMKAAIGLSVRIATALVEKLKEENK